MLPLARLFLIYSIFLTSVSLGSSPIFDNDNQLGLHCIIPKSGQIGQCVLITECPALIAALPFQEYTVCGYFGSIQIVCCPKFDQPFAPTTTERITTKPPFIEDISKHKCFEYHNPKHVHQSAAGGIEATPSEFPHMAIIGYPNGVETDWMCGGSLISEQFVLTAAHCITTRNSVRPDRVKLGVHSIRSEYKQTTDISQEYAIAESIPHPQYRARYNYHDIGLLRLAEWVQIYWFVRPACLPVERTYNDQAGSTVVATGWGSTEYKGKPSDHLVKVELELYHDAECSEAYRDVAKSSRLRDGIDPGTQFCAGSHTAVRDTCEADSGGPLQTNKTDDASAGIYEAQFTIIGITSFGKPCGFVNSPGVYTRVHAYLEWIEQIVWPQ